MDINIEQEKIIELLSPFTLEEVHERAQSRRMDAFGQIIKFMQRPKPEEIEISDTELRYQPFWYGAARAVYKYDRRHHYSVQSASEVKGITLEGRDYSTDDTHHFQFDAIEHCEEDIERQLMLDPESGAEGDYHKYLAFPKRQVPALEALQKDDAVVVVPEVRSSFLVGKLTQALMKTIQADQIFEQSIDVTDVILYYRPVYAFEFLWKTRDKRSVVELDALTGELRAEPGHMQKQIVRVLDNDDLFDIGADAIGTFVPGANIAVKLGRLAARKALK
jgi:hypothetical protein